MATQSTLDHSERLFYDQIMQLPIFSTSLGRLYQGDCLTLLTELSGASVDLVFADPPFNLGKDYGKGITDSLAEEQYLGWCARWIAECARVLKPGGAIYLYNLPRWNVELGHLLGTEGMRFRHWIAVDIKFSLPIPGRLYPSHYSLLYYTKGKPRHFNRPRVPIPVCRHCGGDLKDYGGHRDKLNPEGLNLTDVWTDIPPVRHRSTKRRSANELSLKLLRRVLEISTQPGDVVLDPFGGSGTTFAAAEEMHRHWIGMELGDCEPIMRRLRGEAANVVPRNLGDAAKGLSHRRLPGGPDVEQLRLLERADHMLYEVR
jgi:site-specific DNA-methyltransferase (adenine-specific)